MTHIKLFEDFMSSGSSINPVIVAKGDWSGILLNPTNENIRLYADSLDPSTFIVDYLTNPKTGETPYPINYIYKDAEEICYEIISGDQSGSNLAPKNYATSQYLKGSQADMDQKTGILRLSINSSIDPEEIRSNLQKLVDTINTNPIEPDQVEVEIASDPSSSSIFTPEFIRHCKMVTAGKPGSMMRKLIFNIRE